MNFLDGHLFPENQQPLIITAAPYAPGWLPSDFPEDIPVTMEEQIQKAVDCYNAGATVLHLHVRELDGKGSKRLSKFNELIAGVRKAVPEMIIQVGGSISFAPETEGAAAKWLSDDTRHMLAELEPVPDQVTVTVNTSQMNVTEQAEDADFKGTSREVPAIFNAYKEMTVPSQPGWVEEHIRRLTKAGHPERVPVLQHQQLRVGRAADAQRRLQGPAGDELGGHRRRHGRAQRLQPGQLRARGARRRGAHRGEQRAQCAAREHDGHRRWACTCAAAPRTACGTRSAAPRPARCRRSSSWCASPSEFGRPIATAKQAREISKIGVFYDTVEESLAANGFAPNRNGANQGFLRKVFTA